MGELLTAEKISLFSAFAVPGIVALYVRAQFLSGRMGALSEAGIAYLTISLVYHGIAYAILRTDYVNAAFVRQNTLQWVLIIFFGPALLGLVLGLNVRKGWGSALLLKLGIATVHPVDCAWDWRFGSCKECWVLVKLKDDTTWAGWLGTTSFASSDRGERDLYIEKVYEIADDHQWVERSSSVWLAHGEIRSIEFWPA